GGDGVDAQLAQLEQAVELAAVERRLLAAGLYLDEVAAAGHHQVQVHVGVAVLDVLQVEQLLVVEQADADGGDAVAEDFGQGRQRRQGGGLARGEQGIDEGDVGAVDGRGARAAVGFQDVAVDPEGAFADLGQVDDGAEAAADESLDFDAAAIDPAAAVARLARGRAAGEHSVFGGEPALAGADQERRHRRFDAAGA